MNISSYVIRTVLRADNPLFPKYQIFLRGRLIGVQFSVPSVSDCDWYARGGVYATTSKWVQYREYAERGKDAFLRSLTVARRGRPSKEEQARKLEHVAHADSEDDQFT